MASWACYPSALPPTHSQMKWGVMHSHHLASLFSLTQHRESIGWRMQMSVDSLHRSGALVPARRLPQHSHAQQGPADCVGQPQWSTSTHKTRCGPPGSQITPAQYKKLPVIQTGQVWHMWHTRTAVVGDSCTCTNTPSPNQTSTQSHPRPEPQNTQQQKRRTHSRVRGNPGIITTMGMLLNQAMNSPME